VYWKLKYFTTRRRFFSQKVTLKKKGLISETGEYRLVENKKRKKREQHIFAVSERFQTCYGELDEKSVSLPRKYIAFFGDIREKEVAIDRVETRWSTWCNRCHGVNRRRADC